ncbi:hypothetical protein [Candidatus Xianfuyuplasma coldseepsis]|uniref:Capsule polysaccharide biosynthesis protein n=1 Tax=Candidatus Xianfuyuplasma coldseepsis TaxID=2782163 RepID=A0A7L7KP24_9MOLU|nr:hypothetical protein [Xianfuyuplasma coldseepsis]QMS84531.1 hypothetical protein G4Z02_01805 [Xianfuyuplasma coldseepsis]
MRVEDKYSWLLLVEKELDLFDCKIRDIYVWELIRSEIYLALLEREQLRTEVKHSQRLKNLYFEIKYYNRLFYFTRRKNVEHIIIEHSQYKSVNNNNIDIFTNSFINSSYQFTQNTLILSTSKERTVKDEDIIYLGIYNDFFTGFNYLKNKYLFRMNIPIKMLSFKQLVDETYGIKLDIKSIILRSISSFEYKYKTYRKILNKLNPKSIVLTVAYSYKHLIHAARSLGITVNELQHGIIDDFTIEYALPNSAKYIPDNLYFYGNYWKKSITYKPYKYKAKLYRINYIHKFDGIITQEKKMQNRVLVISQWTIHEELFQFIVDLAQKFPNYEFVYRLHPLHNLDSEGEKIVDEYTHSLSNLIIEESNVDILKSLLITHFVIGCYSTAIFEALYFKCKVYIYDNFGSKHLSSFVNKNLVYRGNNTKDFSQFLKWNNGVINSGELYE